MDPTTPFEIVYSVASNGDMAEGRVESASDAVFQLLGVSAQEFLRDPARWRERIHPDDIDVIRNTAGRLEDGFPVVRQYRFRIHGSVDYVWIEDVVVPQLDEAGQLVRQQGIARNVTQRVRDSERLATLARAVEQTGDHVVVTDPEGKVVWVNPAFESFTGYRLEEIAGHTLAFLKSGHHDASFYRNFWGALAAGQTWKGVFVNRRKDGVLFYEEKTVAPVRDAAGALLNYVSTGRDITARIEMIGALRESEERYREVFENANDIIYTMDLAGNFTSGNQVAEGVTGYSLEELLRLNMRDLVAPDSLPLALEMTRRKVAGDVARTSYEIDLLTKEGGRVRVEVSTRLIVRKGNAIGIQGIARDISERRKAEAAHRESEEKFRAVAESASAAIWLQRHPSLLFVNDAMVELTGYSREQLLEPGFFSKVLHPDDRDLVWNRGAARLRGEDLPIRYEFRIVTQAGEERWVDFSSTAITLGGEPAAVAVAFDITESKRAEAARQQAESRLQVVTSAAPIILFAVDNEGRFTLSEGKGLESIGLLPGQLVGQSLFDVYRDFPDIIEHLRDALAGQPGSLVSRFGETEFAARYDPVFTGGKVSGVVGVAVEVTEQRKAEAARQRAEQHVHTVTQNAPIILFAVDNEGVVSVLEGRGLEGLGIDGSAAAGRSMFDLGFPAELTARIQAALAGEPGALESKEITTQGLVFDLSLSPMRDDHDQFSGIVGVAVNVTERRQAEESLLRAQKLESLGVLAGGIAHDFNNLLVGILGNAGVALAALPDSSDLRTVLEDIERAGVRAADLARQMLAYAGKGALKQERVDVNALVAEMTELLRASISKSVEIRSELSQRSVAVQGDATQLRQVVMNLVVNASDAVEGKNGVVTVRTGTMHVDADFIRRAYLADEITEGDYVFVQVSDTGIGMTRETQRRIFDPFFTTKFAGRGLGLAATLGIIRGHHGGVVVQSDPGKGTTFTILLPPVEAAAVVERRPSAPLLGEAAHGTAIVIDDEESVRSVAVRALQLFGFNVVAAHDGPHGIELMKKHRGQVSFVLLDLTMPGMDGRATLAALRDISPGIPVLLMSGYTEEDTREQFSGRGLEGFIQKPFSLQQLRDEVEKALALHG